MINSFKIKKITTILVLLFAGFYCSGQNLFNISVPSGSTHENGTPFQIRLNPIASGCDNLSISLNIGTLQYMVNSNTLPNGVVVTPVGNVLNITGISNVSGGSSQEIYIGVQFPVNTCDGSSSSITSTLTACGNTINGTSITVTPQSSDKSKIKIQQLTPYPTIPATALCLNQTVMYRVTSTNIGTSGFNITNAKVSLQLPVCAQVVVYKFNTYVPVSPAPVVTTGGGLPANTQKVEWNNGNLMLTTNTQANSWDMYDVYVYYPCNQASTPDCANGDNILNVSLLGTRCGSSVTINDANSTVTTKINNTCSVNNCATGGATPLSVTGNDYYVKCVTSCQTSTMYFNINTPVNSSSIHPNVFEITIPDGVIVDNLSYNYYPCGTPSPQFLASNGTTVVPMNLAKKIRWTLNCGNSSPQISFIVYFHYAAVPPSANPLVFPYTLTTDNASFNLSGNINANMPACTSLIEKFNHVRKASQPAISYATAAAGVPGEIFTYRLTIRNMGSSANLNTVISDLLDSKLIYMGNFRYTVGTTIGASLSDLVPNFSCPGLGPVNVIRPNVGTSGGQIILNNFDFPCGTDVLYIEFDVKLKNNVLVNTTIPNIFSVNSIDSYATQITASALTKVTTKMLAKCGNTGYWSQNPLNVKNNEVISFKMRLTNEGSEPVKLLHLINQKPNIGDQFEFGSINRNSTFAINYDCTSSPQVTTNLATTPVVTYNYSANAVNTDRTMLCPPIGTVIPNWTATCGANPNWFIANFPANFTLNPADYVEIEYKGVVSGATGVTGSAFNTFSFKLDGCPIYSDKSNTLALVNNGVGCVNVPCADFLWEIDGSFESCSSFASGSTFNGSLAGGWSNLNHSIDTRKLPLTSQANIPINTNIPASQNGGVFAAGIAKYFSYDIGFYESFKATIPNLVIGASYRVEFEQINLSLHPFFQNSSVNWEVNFGGVTEQSPALTTSGSPQWSNVSIDFTAVAETQDLIFKAGAPTQVPPMWLPFVNEILYVGIDGIKVISNTTCPPPCYDCTSFDLIRSTPELESKYLVSGWVKEEVASNPLKQYKKFEKGSIGVTFSNANGDVISSERFYATGEIIDGWQRIVGEFVVPEDVDDMKLELINENTGVGEMAYFDDIRVLPTKGSMKSFVYDQKTQRLMAELDENNYGTFYEYDLEGGLVRIKKETEKGVFTIQETRSGNAKN